jgi:hypothetical protein
VTFASEKKYTLPWAKKASNGAELNLARMVKKGDILIKKVSSDTIILIQGDKRYTFVAYRTIE